MQEPKEVVCTSLVTTEDDGDARKQALFLMELARLSEHDERLEFKIGEPALQLIETTRSVEL